MSEKLDPSERPAPMNQPSGLAGHLSFGHKPSDQPKLVSEGPGAVAGLRHFSLKEVGIDQARFFKSIANSFDALPIDNYERVQQQTTYLLAKLPSDRENILRFLPDYFCGKASVQDINHLLLKLSKNELKEFEQIGTLRRHALARFEVTFNIAKFPEIERVSAPAFLQTSARFAEIANLPRYYPEISDLVTDHSCLKQLCRIVALITKGLNKTVYSLSITLHQLNVLVQKNQRAHNIDICKQNGADYVVSALPVILENVAIPVNAVYDADKQVLFKTRLQIGEAVLHDDRIYSHSLSAPRANAELGRSGLFSLDIDLTSFQLPK